MQSAKMISNIQQFPFCLGTGARASGIQNYAWMIVLVALAFIGFLPHMLQRRIWDALTRVNGVIRPKMSFT
jgi:hypothetical protein